VKVSEDPSGSVTPTLKGEIATLTLVLRFISCGMLGIENDCSDE
jgi:hypothetical protein